MNSAPSSPSSATRAQPPPPPLAPNPHLPVLQHLTLPPPPAIVPRRPNLGNWADHDHARLRHALQRIPSWNIPGLAAAMAKPAVEVMWHLSTVQMATVAAHQQEQCAQNPLEAVLMGFNQQGNTGLANQSPHYQQPATVPNGAKQADGEDGDDGSWQSSDEDHDPDLYALESDKATIAKEEDASTRAAKKMDKLVMDLNQKRPLSRSHMHKVGVFYRNRMVKIMSHHHNDDNPLVVLNDTWLDLHAHLVAFIRARIASAYHAAHNRLQQASKPGTHIVVDHLTAEDMDQAIAVCAAQEMRHGIARARADRLRVETLAHWWHSVFVPANPAFRDEQRRKVEKMFETRGIDLRTLRAWQPKEQALARLDHVFVKARRMRRKARVARGRAARDRSIDLGEHSATESSEPSCDESDGWSNDHVDGPEVAQHDVPVFGRALRLLDASLVKEPVKLPNPQGLFHVDALISVCGDDDTHSNLDESRDGDEEDEDSHLPEMDLDAEGLPPSGQGQLSKHMSPPRRSATLTRRAQVASDGDVTPKPFPSSPTPLRTPALFQVVQPHAAQAMATPTASSALHTPGPRRRPIRYRIGLDAEQDDASDDPPSVLRSSRRAKRPLPQDEDSPTRSRSVPKRWLDSASLEPMDASDDDDDEDSGSEGAGESGQGAREGRASSQSDEESSLDLGLGRVSSWNGRSTKRARFA